MSGGWRQALWRAGGFLFVIALCFSPPPLGRYLLACLAAALTAELVHAAQPGRRLVVASAAAGGFAISLAAFWVPLNLAWTSALAAALGAAVVFPPAAGRGYGSVLAVVPASVALILAGMTGADPDPWPGTHLLLILLAIGLQDTTAMLVGRRWPAGRLLPRISPNKTSSGAIAGLAVSFLFLEAAAPLAGRVLPSGTAVGILVCAQASDLYFSAVKRVLKVKDFSRVLGEKGGLLDRADSMILPFALLGLLLR